MTTILIVILVIVLLGGGGGYYGANAGWGGPQFGGLLGLILVVLIILWLAGGVHAAELSGGAGASGSWEGGLGDGLHELSCVGGPCVIDRGF